MDRVSQVCRRRHLNRRTEDSYCYWIRGYIYVHSKQHPVAVGANGITPFIKYLASDQKVAASTQSQALNAIFCGWHWRSNVTGAYGCDVRFGSEAEVGNCPALAALRTRDMVSMYRRR